MTTTSDISTLDQLRTLVREKIQDILDKAEKNAEALGIDLDTSVGDPLVQISAGDVEEESGGALASEDYERANKSAAISSQSDDDFKLVFETTQMELVTDASENLNAYTRQSLTKAKEFVDDLDALAAEIASEAAKISIASAAGLYVPPQHDDIVELRATAQQTQERAEESANDLRSAQARRISAKRELKTDDLYPVATDHINDVPQRYFEETVVSTPEEGAPMDVNQSLTVAGRSGLDGQSTRLGRADAKLKESTAILQASALDKLQYIAVCMAMDSLTTSTSTKARAERVYSKFTDVIGTILSTLDAGFLRTLQTNVQELAADRIESLADTLQDKLDSIDTWLALNQPELPTFVSLVENIGDTISDTPILESLAAQCDLRMTSFCESQNLLEVAKGLDAGLGIVLPRISPILGRVRLEVVAPEQEGLDRPVEQAPDLETSMLLVSISGSDVTARLRRQDILSDFVTETPIVSGGVLAADVLAGATSFGVTGADANIASQGTVTVDGIDYRYSKYLANTFSLIDPATTLHAASTAVQATGEIRDTFVDAFAKTSNIHGGEGKLILEADGETREKIHYASSDFDDGEYTFHLDSPPAYGHAFTVSGRPHRKSKTILFKGTDLLTNADRFKVTGDQVTKDGEASYDFSAIIASEYLGTGPYRLLIGNSDYGVEVASVAVGAITLAESFYDGNQTNVILSRVYATTAPATTTVRFDLDQRQRFDVDVLDLVQGTSKALSARVTLGAGGDTKRVSSQTSSITNSGTTLTLTPVKPLVMGDEFGFAIEVQSGVRSFRSAVTAVGTGTLSCLMAKRLGTVTIIGAAVTGVNTKFKTEFTAGDYVYAVGSAVAKITDIADDTTMTLNSSPGDVAGADVYITPPVNALVGGAARRTINVWRTPREVRDVVSVARSAVDEALFEFTLSLATTYAHDLQEPTIVPGVQIVSDNIQGFLTHFSSANDNVIPRFDPNIVPPNSVTVKTVLENPDAATIYDPFVLVATQLWAKERALDVAGVFKNPDDTYVFTLVAPGTPFPLADGEIVEVETTDIFDQFKLTFGTGWSTEFDTFFAVIGGYLEDMNKKLCLLLTGRPQDLAWTAAAITAAVLTFRVVLFTLSITLQTMILALASSTILKESIDTFEKSGMDAAAERAKNGDIEEITKMTPETATSEGQARVVVDDYKQKLVLSPDAQIADDMASAIVSNDTDKRLLAAVRRPYTEIVADEKNRKVIAAKGLELKSEMIT